MKTSGMDIPWLMLCALATACAIPESENERLEAVDEEVGAGRGDPATQNLKVDNGSDRQTEGFDMDIDEAGGDVVLTFADQPGASQYTLWQSSVPYFAPGDENSNAVATSGTATFTIATAATGTDDAYWRVTTDDGGTSTTVGRWVQALGPGYNMLGFPLLTSDTLAAESFNAAHPEFTEIWVYDNESDGFDIWFGTGEENLTWSAGDSIAVLNGGGADVLRHFGHVPVAADLAFELPQNRSMVTLPLSMDPTDAQGLYGLMPSASIISTYDQPSQTRLDFYPPEWGTNFTITPGQGVMLTLDAPMLWPPGYTPPEPALGLRLVTNYNSANRDSFQICDRDAAGAWSCEVVTLPQWATWIRGDHRGVQFEAIDANGDGVSGFVTFREHALQCELVDGAWTCAELDNGTQDYRRIGETDVFDFDGDGFEDLVYSQTDNGPQVCYGGTFPMSCQDLGIGGGSRYRASDYADFDGDGNTDVFLSYYYPWNTGYSQLCFGDGQGGFSCQNFTASSTSTSSANTDAEVFDANGDGLLDLYVEFAPIYGATGELCLNDPMAPGSFSCSPMVLPSIHYQGAHWGQGSNDVTAADMDGDGDQDLAMGSRGAPYICWNEGTGLPDCSYLDGATHSDIDGAADTQLELLDVNGDGLLDIIRSGLVLTLHINQGDRTFAAETILSGSVSQNGVAVLPGHTP